MAGLIGSHATVVSSGAERKKHYDITTTTTSLTGLQYTPTKVHVYHNGIRLVDGTDYTATNGTSITLTNAAENGDDVVVVSYATFQPSDTVSAANGGTFAGDVDFSGDLTVDTNTLHVDSTNNRVGIGTSSPSHNLHVSSSGGSILALTAGSTENAQVRFGDSSDDDAGKINYDNSTNHMAFHTNASERMRIDSSGNLLVGDTSATFNDTAKTVIRPSSDNWTIKPGVVHSFNRTGSDGDILEFYKTSSSKVASIGSRNGSDAYISLGNAGLTGSTTGGGALLPTTGGTTYVDNVVDLGFSTGRYDNIYATNGTINTSDQNEKQQIASLTDAEITAAKAISKLFKTFKWNSAVESKGDAARTHSGVIAQEVEQAMTDAGLNAGDYAFWCSDTWWEAQTEVPAVEADEENGVEAQEAYTRTDTYDTLEEAPEGATERNRKGIRYPELLSFIGAATEQRLASIESRLDALENA
jgi:hypothetical protein